jgi:hypothetical protein
MFHICSMGASGGLPHGEIGEVLARGKGAGVTRSCARRGSGASGRTAATIAPPPHYETIAPTIHPEHLLSNEPPVADTAIDPAPASAESPKKKKPDTATLSKAGLWTAAGVGIGSAAIAAALIYANRAKARKDG